MRKWLPLLAICLGSFMLLIDVTIVNVALPDMAGDLSTSFSSLQWVIDGYALALAALLLAVGSLSDTFGHRRTYLAGLGLFAVASVICGLAPDIDVLVVARIVQGVGGAAMFATTFALLNQAYTGRDRGTAYGIWGAVSGAAAAIGPILGGVLTQAISWRWIFFVNAPVGVATILLTVAVVPAAARGRRRGVDLGGTFTFTVAAAALTYALTRTSDDGWTSISVLCLLGLAVASLLAFVVIEDRRRLPLLDLGLFRHRTFVGTVLAAFVLSFSAFAALTFTTIWTQSLLGLSPIASGLVNLPLPVLSATLSATSGRHMHRLPRPLVIGGGVVLIGIGGLLCALLVTPHASWTALLPGLAIIGVGCGISVPTLSATATAAVGDDRVGMASGAINTGRQLGQALGIALLGSLVAASAESSLRGLASSDPAALAHELVGGQAQDALRSEGPHVAHLDAAFHAAFASGLDLAFLVAGLAAVITGTLVAWLVRNPSPASPAAPARSTDAPRDRRADQADTLVR